MQCKDEKHLDAAEKVEPIGEMVGHHNYGSGEMPTIRWKDGYWPSIGTQFYTHPAPAVPEVPAGWQLVPKQPTLKMIDAGADVDPEHESVWHAMLSAAPTPPTPQPNTDSELLNEVLELRAALHDEKHGITAAAKEAANNELREAAMAAVDWFYSTHQDDEVIDRLRKAL